MSVPPEVSVVIPTRNRWDLLRRSLRAALLQEDVELEVLVVDDASDEAGASRVDALSHPSVRLLRHESNRGVAASRNTGIVAARGRWIAFLDDDDVWAPHKLRLQLERARREDCSFAYSGAVILDQDLNAIDVLAPPRSADLDVQLLAGNVVPGGPSSLIVCSALLRSLGGFDTELSILADWDLLIRLAHTGRGAACPEPLVGYVQHPGNLHIASPDEVVSEFEYVTVTHGTRARAAGVSPDTLELSRWIASGHLRSGRRAAAARAYLQGAIANRSVGNLARAAAALVRPLRIGRRRRTVSAPGWIELFVPSRQKSRSG